MKRIRASIIVFLLLLASLAACAALGGSEPTTVPEATAGSTSTAEVSHGGPIDDFVSLVDTLRAAGAAVEPGETLEQPFFEPAAQIVTVDGEQVQIFAFATEEAARAAADTVSESGSAIGTTMVTWQDTPHFYRVDRLIVLYVGSDATVLDRLQQVLGDPFAGG